MPGWRVACDPLRTPVFIEDCSIALSGLSHKFLDITIVSLKFASSIVLGEGPVDRFAVAIALVRPHQHGPI